VVTSPPPGENTEENRGREKRVCLGGGIRDFPTVEETQGGQADLGNSFLPQKGNVGAAWSLFGFARQKVKKRG